MKRIIYLKIFTLIVLFLLPEGITYAQAAQADIGLPFIKYYSSKEYRAHGQNFDIVQDNRGILYFANFSGALEFDGASWRTIPTAGNSKVTSIAKDKKGRIFIGARGEFGYLAPDNTGALKFVNISNKLKKEESDFTEIIGTFCSDYNVWFVSEKKLFLWNWKTLKVIKTENAVISAFYVNNTLYCYEKDKGLKMLQNEQLVPVKGTEKLLPSLEFYAMIPMNEGKILLGSGNMGLYLLDGNSVSKFSTEAEDFLVKNKISCGIRLNNGNLALGTTRGGIVIIRPDGRIAKIIDLNSGLQNENVKALYVDKANSLWAALNNGIALIEVESPLSYISESAQLKGGVTSILRQNNRLYFGTYSGLAYLQDNSREFRTVNGITTACWALLKLENTMLAATSEGVFEIKNDAAFQITNNFALSLYRSKSDPAAVYVCGTDGITKLIISGTSVKAAGKITAVNKEVRAVAEDDKGYLWINSPFYGIYRYSLSDKTTEHFDTTKGLRSIIGNSINVVGGKIYVTSQHGVFSFDYQKLKFVKNETFLGNKSEWYYKIIEDDRGNLVTNNGEETGLSFFTKAKNGGYVNNPHLLLPVSDFITWTIYPDNDNRIWFGGPDGLIILNKAVKENTSGSFPAFIRRVSAGTDKNIFNGTFYDTELTPSLTQSGDMKPALNYFENTISFEFGAASYYAKNVNQFQYFLEGFDNGWSDWTTSKTKEYTNLPSGRYKFKVRAKNVYGYISDEAAFEFSISAPWYKAWYAYILYIGLAAGLVIGFVRIRSRKLEKEKQILEKTIEERTAEVVKQKEEIEEKSLELSDKNDELEKINQIVKSINSEIHFANLLQSILNQMLVIKGIEKAAILVYDKSVDKYVFKASYNWDTSTLNPVQLSLETAERIYLKNMNEIYEDIFYSDNFRNVDFAAEGLDFEKSASMLVLVTKIDDKAEGFLILENVRRKDAFSQKDILFIKNLKEHIISAFIKTKILEDLQATLDNLKDAQTQLVQSEKLASLGQLTAGIAHEIKNPLNFINNFSDLSKGLITELDEELTPFKQHIDEKTLEILDEIMTDLKGNLTKINDHGKRVDSIVKGMLLHSRGKSGEMQKSSINQLLNEFISLAYHGFRAQDSTFNVKLETVFDESIEMINVVPQNLSRVFINILNNACYSTNEKKKEKGTSYAPVLSISTKNLGDKVEIKIRDNGKGIPQAILDKIFNPFFTTKPAGKGTGLGLSLSYDIITQEHKGEIKIESQEGEFAEFTITIPKNLTQQ
jgi:signal transduction histidine kinase/ligand-binding sensor domain-containing protein